MTDDRVPEEEVDVTSSDPSVDEPDEGADQPKAEDIVSESVSGGLSLYIRPDDSKWEMTLSRSRRLSLEARHRGRTFSGDGLPRALTISGSLGLLFFGVGMVDPGTTLPGRLS